MLVGAHVQTSARPARGRCEGYPVSRDHEETNRVLGMSRRDAVPHAREGEEPKRVLGFPVDWYGPVEGDLLRSLRHPIKVYRRWALIRRLGPYAPDDESDP